MPSKESNAQRVLVSGIGGNVGQGILRNIKSAFPQLEIIGTDVSDFTAGHYFCDFFEKVPYSYDSSFHNRFLEIVNKLQPSLIIPSTDFETVSLAEIRNNLPSLIASPLSAVETFLDKQLTWKACREGNLPFAASSEITDVDPAWDEIIVKPKKGRGSRGVHINPSVLKIFNEEYMAQELVRGVEITTAFYVTKSDEIRGPFSMERQLVNGMTERCHVYAKNESELEQLVSRYAKHFKIQGPCNIQSIVADSGVITPFEINCRYSGTNSIRSHFGFEDVKWGIEEYLFNTAPSDYTTTKGSAVRIYMDIVYPDSTQVSVGPKGAILA